MELDITIHKGRIDKPVVIFIHGLGVDKNFWVNPLDTKIFAKNIPLKIFAATQPEPCSIQSKKRISLGKVPEKINNLCTALKMKSFNVICWSQKRPVGPISAAVEELEGIMERVKKIFSGNPVALIGHSRGGLIARKFMERKIPEIKALVTISTPHAGSSLAHLGKFLSPLSPILKGILPKNAHGTISGVIKNINELLESNAAKELLPDSDFFKNLKDSPSKGIKYVSFGGTETKLLTVYSWKKKDNKIYPKPLLTMPNLLLKIFPASIIPDEITPGKGDVLVSAKSSLLPWASRHYNLPANHISITWHKKTINNIIEILEEI